MLKVMDRSDGLVNDFIFFYGVSAPGPMNNKSTKRANDVTKFGTSFDLKLANRSKTHSPTSKRHIAFFEVSKNRYFEVSKNRYFT